MGTTELMVLACACSTKEEARALVERFLDLEEEKCVVGEWLPRGQAREILLSIIGYMAGYYDHETGSRLWALFETGHPYFGTRWPTQDEAFVLGLQLGKILKERRDGGN